MQGLYQKSLIVKTLFSLSADETFMIKSRNIGNRLKQLGNSSKKLQLVLYCQCNQ